MSHRHAIVWLDHFHGTVIDFSIDDANTVKVRSKLEAAQVHTKSGSLGSGHLAEDVDFYAQVVAAIGGASEVVVVGPGLAKTAFKKFVEERFPHVARRIVGVETMDHPTDGQLLAFARTYVRRVDNLLQHPL